jgi:hypothetical protein
MLNRRQLIVLLDNSDLSQAILSTLSWKRLDLNRRPRGSIPMVIRMGRFHTPRPPAQHLSRRLQRSLLHRRLANPVLRRTIASLRLKFQALHPAILQPSNRRPLRQQRHRRPNPQCCHQSCLWPRILIRIFPTLLARRCPQKFLHSQTEACLERHFNGTMVFL